MATKKEILIIDSCILFDLLDLDLIEDFFCMEYQVCTTNEVIREIEDEHQINIITKYILRGNLKVDQSGLLESKQSLFDEFSGLSFTDCSVLELSFRKNGSIITSDKGLRNISKRQKITVKGMLWIIVELVNTSIISKNVALKSLKTYPKVNVRAPINEINKLIEMFENNQL